MKRFNLPSRQPPRDILATIVLIRNCLIRSIQTLSNQTRRVRLDVDSNVTHEGCIGIWARTQSSLARICIRQLDRSCVHKRCYFICFGSIRALGRRVPINRDVRPCGQEEVSVWVIGVWFLGSGFTPTVAIKAGVHVDVMDLLAVSGGVDVRDGGLD